MKRDKRNFIIISKHKRWQRLWQFFFTGWGIIMLALLVAGALFTKQLLWTPIAAINMRDIASNQFKMTNAIFQGVDKNGEPFKITAKTGRQEYDKPDIIYLDTVRGNATRIKGDKKIKYNFSSNAGEYNRKARTVKMIGDVDIRADDGSVVQTNELVLKI